MSGSKVEIVKGQNYSLAQIVKKARNYGRFVSGCRLRSSMDANVHPTSMEFTSNYKRLQIFSPFIVLSICITYFSFN